MTHRFFRKAYWDSGAKAYYCVYCHKLYKKHRDMIKCAESHEGMGARE